MYDIEKTAALVRKIGGNGKIAHICRQLIRNNFTICIDDFVNDKIAIHLVSHFAGDIHSFEIFFCDAAQAGECGLGRTASGILIKTHDSIVLDGNKRIVRQQSLINNARAPGIELI